MKKISLVLVVCLMAALLGACGGTAETTDPSVSDSAESSDSTPEESTVPTAPKVISPTSKVIDFSLDTPEGFTASVVQDSFTFLISPNAPVDTSSITVETTPRDESVLTRTAEEFEAMVTGNAASEESHGTDAPAGHQQFSLSEMQNVDLDGWPALMCKYDLSFTGFSSHILRYEVVANNANYVFTFTDTTDERLWQDAFARSAETIHLILDSEGIALDYSNLTLYDLGIGLSIYAEEGLLPQKAEGFSACIGSRDVIILVTADNKQENYLTELDALGYADLLRQNNELDEFQTNLYGNLYTHFYTTDEVGNSYYNMICIAETEADFLVLQFACLRENQPAYAKQFPLWASSITQNT